MKCVGVIAVGLSHLMLQLYCKDYWGIIFTFASAVFPEGTNAALVQFDQAIFLI